MQLTDGLRQEYQRLFDGCAVRPDKVAAVDAIADRVVKNQARYQAVALKVGTVPWFVIGAIHNLEAGLRFTTHLHNGDPLTARTVHVPAGRPRAGHPPFTWEVSAIDALKQRGLDKVTDWSVPSMLFHVEGYNGYGYRLKHPEVLSPYLWSFTNHYTAGKFVADHKFSSKAVSAQCGAMALLVRLRARKQIALAAPGVVHAQSVGGVRVVGKVPFPGVVLSRANRSHGVDVARVQDRLRHLGFHIDAVAGSPFGPQTQAAVTAFQRAHRLVADGKVGKDTWKALFG